MKKLVTLIAVILVAVNVFAQSPEKMSYQAVVRNASNGLISNTTIGMKISILQNSTSGTEVYAETQTSVTDANGLATLEIGTGSIISGEFSTINWSAGPYFIKTETDPSGGTTYTITGTSQLMSVPYALHAKTVSSFNEEDPKIGEILEGYFPIWDGSNLVSGTVYEDDGYVGIGTETPESELHVAGLITTDDYGTSDDWNTAFGWGDHAAAGYVQTTDLESKSDVADEFTATTSQTVFTLSQTPSANSIVKMYINGIRISNTAYSHSGTTLIYEPLNNGSYTLTDGDRIQFDYMAIVIEVPPS